MKSWLWNGSAFEAHDSVPVEDRGFRYGMALFESLRVWRQRPLFLEQHLQRLRRACTDRHFPFDEKALSGIGPLLREAGMDGFARIYVTAGDGPATELPRGSRVFVLLEKRECPRLDPCNATIASEPHRPLFGGLKTANYWANIEALHRAMHEGKDDALLFNDQAELISACMANVFVVHRTKMRTPALPCGARDGVVREWVLEQVNVKEGSLFIEDLQTADEIFITNSWLGLRSVGRIAGRELPSRAVCERLSIAYERTIEAG